MDSNLVLITKQLTMQKQLDQWEDWLRMSDQDKAISDDICLVLTGTKSKERCADLISRFSNSVKSEGLVMSVRLNEDELELMDPLIQHLCDITSLLPDCKEEFDFMEEDLPALNGNILMFSIPVNLSMVNYILDDLMEDGDDPVAVSLAKKISDLVMEEEDGE